MELIKIGKNEIAGVAVQTVNARELHGFLESKQDFSTWIKSRIEQYEFSESIDFTQFHNFMESKSKARIEYHLSIDMAKELAMVERNERGREARKYFIECERKLKELPVVRPQVKEEPREVLVSRALIAAQGIIEEQSRALEEARPKIELHDAVVYSGEKYDMGTSARFISSGIPPEIKRKVGRNNLVKYLKKLRWIMEGSNKPYQKFIDMGLILYEPVIVKTGPVERLKFQSFLTGKGLSLIAKTLNKAVVDGRFDKIISDTTPVASEPKVEGVTTWPVQ